MLSVRDIAATPLDEAKRRFKDSGVAIEVGPVERSGATAASEWVYIRNLGGNLVEVSAYRRHPAAKPRSFPRRRKGR